MAEAASKLTRHDLEAKIVKRCWEDEGFRKEFTADPAGAFVKYLEVPAADLPKIVVHEEGAGSWHIVVPAKPANANELSEADLEKVAGGTSYGQLLREIGEVMLSVGKVYDGVARASAASVAASAATVSAAGVSGAASLVAGQNVDTGW
jgi:hypothetical protein